MNTKTVAVAVIAIIVVVAVAGVTYWMMNDNNDNAPSEDPFVPYEMYSEGKFEYTAPGFMNDDLTEYYFAVMNINLTHDLLSFENIAKYVRTEDNMSPETWENCVQEALDRVYDTNEWEMLGMGIEEIQDRMIRSFGFLDGWTAIPTAVEYELNMPIDGVYFHEFTAYKFVKGGDAIYVATNGLILEAYLYDVSAPGHHFDFMLNGASRLSEYGPSIYS